MIIESTYFYMEFWYIIDDNDENHNLNNGIYKFAYILTINKFKSLNIKKKWFKCI